MFLSDIKKIKTFLALMLLFSGFFAVVPQAQAAMMTGKQLLSICTSTDNGSRFVCEAYISGVVDYHNLLKTLGTAPNVDFCIPDTTGIERLREAVAEYFKINPQHHDFTAAPAVALGLFEIYPCKGK